jgi:hypothetical protein
MGKKGRRKMKTGKGKTKKIKVFSAQWICDVL